MNTSNLVALWEKHCRDEFEKRDINATMATMVPQPYVNHIPTMTGGVGYEQLKRFYAYHFIPINPPDFRLTLISRTVGKDTIVDEFIVKFTHTTEIDWPDSVDCRPILPWTQNGRVAARYREQSKMAERAIRHYLLAGRFYVM